MAMLTATLFGDDAFVEDRLFLLSPIKEFCDALTVNTWHGYQKGLMQEAQTIEKQHTALNNAWEGM